MEDIIVDYVLQKIKSVNLKTEHKLSKNEVHRDLKKKKKIRASGIWGTKPSNLRHIIRITLLGRSIGAKRKYIEESCTCMLSHFSHVQLSVILLTVAHQVPLSMGFSRQEQQTATPFSRGSFPTQGLHSHFYISRTDRWFFITSATWGAH